MADFTYNDVNPPPKAEPIKEAQEAGLEGTLELLNQFMSDFKSVISEVKTLQGGFKAPPPHPSPQPTTKPINQPPPQQPEPEPEPKIMMKKQKYNAIKAYGRLVQLIDHISDTYGDIKIKTLSHHIKKDKEKMVEQIKTELESWELEDVYEQ